MADALVQMFDWPFRRVEAALPELAAMGFGHVLVSPPQKSNPSREWWARYQPVDFTRLEGPLGDAGDLARLCHRAAGLGLRIVVDTVLNHMTNDPRWVTMRGRRVLEARFPRFSARDFHGGPGSPVGVRPRLGKGRGLPELRTDTPYVRDELRTYVHDLYGLGVRGFRFDAAKHLDPGLFGHVLHGLPDVLAFGELVLTSASHFPPAVLAAIRALDFPLARTMKEAFAPGGDLRLLVDPGGHGGALWGPSSISFVNGHDLAKRGSELRFFRVGTLKDRLLAHLYILGRADGTPLVYMDDLRHAAVRAGVAFHATVEGAPMRWVLAEPTLLAFARGDERLVVLHKGGRPLAAPALEVGLRPGTYRDWIRRRRHRVDGLGRLVPARIPARGGLLLVREGP